MCELSIEEKESNGLTVSINSSQKVLLETHFIKTFINLVIRSEEVLAIAPKPSVIHTQTKQHIS